MTKIAVVDLLSRQTMAINHVNSSVYGAVPDDLRTKLAHEPPSIWFFEPVLRANKHLDSDS